MSEIQTIKNAVVTLQRTVKLNGEAILGLKKLYEDTSATKADLTTQITSVEESIDDLSDRIATIEERLRWVQLPDETRNYLGESEIDQIRTSIAEMKLAKEELKKTQNQVVSLVTQFLRQLG